MAGNESDIGANSSVQSTIPSPGGYVECLRCGRIFLPTHEHKCTDEGIKAYEEKYSKRDIQEKIEKAKKNAEQNTPTHSFEASPTSIFSMIKKTFGSDVFVIIFTWGMFLTMGFLYYDNVHLKPEREQKEIDHLRETNNIRQLIVFIDGHHGRKGSMAKKALRILGREGNSAATESLISTESIETIVEMLKEGEITDKYLEDAHGLLIKDIDARYRAIADLGNIRSPLTVDILMKGLRSEDEAIRGTSIMRVLRICAYSMRMLQQEPNEPNSYWPAVAKDTWLRDKLLSELSAPDVNSYLKENLQKTISDTDSFISGGSLFLIIHFDYVDLITTNLSKIRQVIKKQIESRKANQAKNNWRLTRRVLLEDVRSGSYDKILNALVAFIGIGKKDIIPELNQILDDEGDKKMAEAFLNSGSAELRNTAESWALRRGYEITQGPGYHPVNWGGW